MQQVEMYWVNTFTEPLHYIFGYFLLYTAYHRSYIYSITHNAITYDLIL